MSLHNQYDKLERGTFHSEMSMIETPEGYALYIKNGTPTNGIADYAPGCVAIDTTNGYVYRNSGTKTSAVWTQLGDAAS